MINLIFGILIAIVSSESNKVIKIKTVNRFHNSDILESYYKINFDKTGKKVSKTFYNADHSIKKHFKYSYQEEDLLTKREEYNKSGELKQTVHSRVNEFGDKIYNKRIYHLRTPVAEYIDQYQHYYNKDQQIIKTERFSGPTKDTIDWVYNYIFNEEGLLIFTDSKFKDEKRDESEYFYKKGNLKKSISYDYMNNRIRLSNSFAKYYYDKNNKLIRKNVKSCYKWKSPRGFKNYIYKYSFNKEGYLVTDEFINDDKSFRLEKTSYLYY